MIVITFEHDTFKTFDISSQLNALVRYVAARKVAEALSSSITRESRHARAHEPALSFATCAAKSVPMT